MLKMTKLLALKELERTELAFKELTVKDSPEARDLFSLADSYFKDAKYFYSKNDYLKALNLLYYVWGILDSGARLGLFDPGKARMHYKIDQP